MKNYSKLKKSELIELLKERESDEIEDFKSRILELEEELEEVNAPDDKYKDALVEFVGTYQKYKRNPEVYTLEDVFSNIESISNELEREEGISGYDAQFTLI
ncbi:hypothetical protein [Lactococcus lactis]|uniref:Uncharacterized protein n=1 Tax=Lactococcus lactis TaxID=1358 RepID=A0AAP3Z124_9LACT|nr:hypothetical protein [Lactococcus lactis]MDG4968270.1 hypothetical protein [Lactococcus lactis]MDG4976370.1 hypothetical protein [Lactococcus lactis]MDG5102174.1 hypothetical protein [Lactococcus lactis]